MKVTDFLKQGGLVGRPNLGLTKEGLVNGHIRTSIIGLIVTAE